MTTLAYLLLGIILGALLVVVLLFRAAWRIAEPDEALIISGFRTTERPDGAGESMGFRIVTGRGCLVVPGLTKVRRLSLEAHESEIAVPCVSQQKIRLDLRGVIVYKVGDDYRSIANAARRFLDRPAQELESKVQNVFVGHLRAIAGSMTVEEMISDQDKFAQQVRDRCTQEMESFGLVIDSFQIQSITSPSNYIENLAVPHQAEVEQNARIARANADRTGGRPGADRPGADRRVAARHRDQEGRLPGRDRHGAAAGRPAGPARRGEGPPGGRRRSRPASPSCRRSRRSSSSRSTSASRPTPRRTGRRRSPRPVATSASARPKPRPRKSGSGRGGRGADQGPGRGAGRRAQDPGQAQADATRLNGQAEADAIKARGLAEADAIRARMEAEAAGIERRAAALSQNQEAVIAQQIAEKLPEIVRAAAAPFEHVGQFTVLNGAQGVTGALAEIIQQAGALTGLARHSLLPAITQATAEAGSGNGSASQNGAEYGNGARNGRRARQTPVTITDPAPAGTDASEEHATK